jgi:hypothetical protein
MSEGKKVEKLGDIMGKEIESWRVGWIFFLELDHRLMGTFPAILTEDTDVIIVVAEKPLLRKVWEGVPRRRSRISKVMAVYNLELGIAFDIRNPRNERTQPLRVFSADEVESLAAQSGAFKWAPGMMSMEDESHVPPPDFGDSE